MLFMVIEKCKQDNFVAIGERFQRSGRMMPEGVVYQASWVDAAGARCFQLMEAPDACAAARPVDYFFEWTRT
jgi:hypothetical protein